MLVAVFRDDTKYTLFRSELPFGYYPLAFARILDYLLAAMYRWRGRDAYPDRRMMLCHVS
jgi:hypothetical protein